MRFGLCCSASRATEAVAAGFDYAEVGAHDLEQNLEAVRGTPIDAANLFFPGSFRLFEPVSGDWMEHSRAVCRAASELHLSVLVIGSGGQRRAPAQMEGSVALREFVRIVEAVAGVAAPFGLRVAPESLNRDETNVGNSLPELARALAEVGVGYTADSYHVLREAAYDGIAPDWAAEVPFSPTHVHFADFPRGVPTFENEETQGFLRRLKALGYDARISFEGSLGTLTLGEAAERLRRLWAGA